MCHLSIVIDRTSAWRLSLWPIWVYMLIVFFQLAEREAKKRTDEIVVNNFTSIFHSSIG